MGGAADLAVDRWDAARARKEKRARGIGSARRERKEAGWMENDHEDIARVSGLVWKA